MNSVLTNDYKQDTGIHSRKNTIPTGFAGLLDGLTVEHEFGDVQG